MSVLQRPFWNGHPEELRELFALAKRDRAAHARCALWTHQFGWELRLTVNGSLIRSQVSRDCAEVVNAAKEWQRTMREEGWRLDNRYDAVSGDEVVAMENARLLPPERVDLGERLACQGRFWRPWHHLENDELLDRKRQRSRCGIRHRVGDEASQARRRRRGQLRGEATEDAAIRQVNREVPIVDVRVHCRQER